MLQLHRFRRVLPIIAILVAGLALQLGAQVVQAITSPPTFVLKWGEAGAGDRQFQIPAGIATDSSGDVYVVDYVNRRVQVFDGNGNYLRQWGASGTADGQFVDPVGIAVDQNDDVYVVEYSGDRVQKFDASGNFLLSWGSPGTQDGEFEDLRDVAVDPASGNILVIDDDANTCRVRVQVFSQVGAFLDSWCATTPSAALGGQLYNSFSVAADSSGNVYVSGNADDPIVVKYSSTGSHLLEFGQSGTGNGQFGSLLGIAVDVDDSILVVDRNNDRIQAFDTAGNYLTQWGVTGSGNGEFDDPGFVAVDHLGAIYVSDIARNDIQKFAPNNPNGPPTVSSVSANLAPVEVDTTVNGNATFTDDDDFDIHTAEWDWGDGNTSTGTVDQGANSVSGSHSYDTPGVYTVSVTVTDPDATDPNSAALSTTEYVVVYDPDGGFATGGGWIDSPLGACTLTIECEDETGKANFGFVSKYKKGASVPSGTTEFQFKAGDLNFNAITQNWLVIAGHNKAKFLGGTGQINQSGDYGYMVTVVDNGGSGDTFRIKIWDNDNGGEVVYDNKMGGGDDGYDGTEIGGGNIKVHKK